MSNTDPTSKTVTIFDQARTALLHGTPEQRLNMAHIVSNHLTLLRSSVETPQPASNGETNRDKVLRREVVTISDDRLLEMQTQAIEHEGIGYDCYHWHWAAAINELIARRAHETSDEQAWLFECWAPGKRCSFATVDENDTSWWPRDQWKYVTRKPLKVLGPSVTLWGERPSHLPPEEPRETVSLPETKFTGQREDPCTHCGFNAWSHSCPPSNNGPLGDRRAEEPAAEQAWPNEISRAGLNELGLVSTKSGAVKARSGDPYKAVCDGGTGGPCTQPDCEICWPEKAEEPARELSASEAASFEKTLARSPRRVEPEEKHEHVWVRDSGASHWHCQAVFCEATKPYSPEKANGQRWKRGGNPEDTYRQGYARFPYSRIVEVFGEPEYCGDRQDGRVVYEWTMTFDDGTIATIYDYKQSKLYGDDPDAPTPEEMKTLPTFEWHIGGHRGGKAVEHVTRALNAPGEHP